MRHRPLTLLALLTACAGGVKSADTSSSSGPAPFSAEALADAIPDSEATTKAQLIKPGKREYPWSLERNGIGGTAEVEFVITETGAADPRTVRIVRASSPDLGSAARSMVIGAKFSPGELNGTPVRVRTTTRITWNPGSDAECQWTGGTSLLPPKCLKPAATGSP